MFEPGPAGRWQRQHRHPRSRPPARAATPNYRRVLLSTSAGEGLIKSREKTVARTKEQQDSSRIVESNNQKQTAAQCATLKNESKQKKPMAEYGAIRKIFVPFPFHRADTPSCANVCLISQQTPEQTHRTGVTSLEIVRIASHMPLYLCPGPCREAS